MTEYLKIKNFGPIEDVELDNIAPLTILVGNSGSGKSTILKVLSLFRWIYKRVVLRSYVKQAKINKTGLGIQIKTLLKTSGLDKYWKTSTEIIYRRGDYEIIYRNNKLNAQASIPQAQLSLEKICFISDKRSMVPDIVNHKAEYRIANYHLKDTVENFLLASSIISELPIDFLNVRFETHKSNAGTQYYIRGYNGNKFSITLKNSSSGTQSTVPLNIIVEYYAKYFDPKKSMDSSLFKYLQDNDRLKDFNTAQNIGEIEQKNVHILIEEPELSLDPDSQCQMIDKLIHSCFIYKHQYNMTLMMATHSPYIVNYINLLLKKWQTQEANVEGVKLNPCNVDVYHIIDGKAISLKIGTDASILIDTRLMSDTISEIYKEYNRL